MNPAPTIRPFFDQATNTVTYLVADATTGVAVVIDPVLGFDPASGEVDTEAVEAVMAEADARGWRIEHVLETHVHADHLSAAPMIKGRTGAAIGIGARIRDVQTIFRPLFGIGGDIDPSDDFDRLFEDGDRIPLGSLEIEVIDTPGHTPADVSYRIGDDIFVGDSLFMPDYGTARADFPGGDARMLYRSIRRILDLPPETRIHTGHDYKAPGRDHFAWDSTVAEQRANNPHVRDGIDEDSFVAMRQERDRTLSPPRLLLPSIQVNINAGNLPDASANGVSFLLIPVKVRGQAA